jgi:3-deoxy-D-manno-octulosonate 8-phosphate phosphatase (KDO 8-P phosphatase)
MNVFSKFDPVTTFVFDMDGALTDGGLWIMPDGEWIRRMNIKDGYVLQLAVKKGYRIWVVTGSRSQPVEKRLNRLGITEVHQQVQDKRELVDRLKSEFGVADREILYMGDDIPDLAVMRGAGVSACPADACRDILDMADYISSMKGGEGCVRDVIEKVMRVQGKWDTDISLAST